MRRATVLLALLAGAAGMAGTPASLRIDQVQVIGSHNSYRPYPSPEARARIVAAAPGEWPALAYGHPPLAEQLDRGLRQVELDVAPDPRGGAYAAPGDADPAMAAPGAKVLHIPGIDTDSHCRSFRACLTILRGWSDRHRGHAPVFVLVNAGDAGGARFDAANLAALDRDIRAVMGPGRIVTPDAVRGRAATLRDAVTRDHAWPTMARAAGRFLFVLDGSTAHQDAYRAGHPSLRGRAMFAFFDRDVPEAVVFNIQDPSTGRDRIAALVRQGFIVRTRADEGLAEPRANDRRRLDAAIASGAQWISSDLYDGAANPERLPYRAAFAGGALSRCDPVTASC
ncbi:Ca2+-dependent phosphoinositide-specific phospholipase C [Sphingomonas hankookensis]|uniref:Calcium-dependent phosphoinositide phospholipase C n=1 Tax=Sphingomonas hengshuiensis TaxID=1609977 RepID=A0A2W5B5N7_9SPHN|nr:MAG: hypothetical protein DI632_06220 [Sphingomonas hengshuiensis]